MGRISYTFTPYSVLGCICIHQVIYIIVTYAFRFYRISSQLPIVHFNCTNLYMYVSEKIIFLEINLMFAFCGPEIHFTLIHILIYITYLHTMLILVLVLISHVECQVLDPCRPNCTLRKRQAIQLHTYPKAHKKEQVPKSMVNIHPSGIRIFADHN